MVLTLSLAIEPLPYARLDKSVRIVTAFSTPSAATDFICEAQTYWLSLIRHPFSTIQTI
jgi:hypothetical protein